MKIATFQKIALALSIIVVLNLVFNLGLSTFYKAPDVDNFCGEETRQIYTTKDSCNAVGGEWIESFPEEADSPRVLNDSTNFTPRCNAKATCYAEHETARDLYNRNIFIALVILGVISLGVGFFAISVKAVSAGFLFGGFISLLVASIRYWSGMNEYLRFIILVILLAGLIFLGYKRLKDKE